MGSLIDWLFGEEKSKQTDDETENNSIIPTEDEIDDLEILEDILED